jgi:hypothetical protein
VRRITAAALVLVAVVVAPASARTGFAVVAAGGVEVSVPAGWRPVGRLSDCSDPWQVLALARSRRKLAIGEASRYRGGLLLVLETAANPFPARVRFRLPAKPSRFEGCCGQPAGPGFEFTIRDGGRDFYAFIFARGRAAREAVAILNTFDATPR